MDTVECSYCKGKKEVTATLPKQGWSGKVKCPVCKGTGREKK